MADEGYTVKEIVDITRKEQTAGFTRIETLIAGKADRSQVEALSADFNTHKNDTDRRFRPLEEAHAAATAAADVRDRARTDRWTFWGLVVASGAAAGGIVTAVVLAVH